MASPDILLEISVADAAETSLLAEDIAAILKPGDVLALQGELGAGKSAFIRALIRALADDDRLEVPSPSFTLVQTYDLPSFSFAHFDLYRLSDSGELREIGFEAAVRGGVVAVEWPDRAGEDLPADALHIVIGDGAGPTERHIVFSGPAARWKARIDRSRRIRDLLAKTPFAGGHRRPLAGDASSRSYERVRASGGTAIVMNWPRRAPQPVLQDGLSYAELVHVQDDPLAFVAVGAILRREGFIAPAVHALDLDRGLMVLEDLGTQLIAEQDRPIPERYLAAAELLAEKDRDRSIWGGDISIRGQPRSYRIPSFDIRAMLVEVSLCLDWYLPLRHGRDVDAAARVEFLSLWRPLAERLVASEQGLVLRDFIAPNLLWRGGDHPRQRLGLLDYQDAMIGPTAYDVMSLATDVRAEMPRELSQAIVQRYKSRRLAANAQFDGEAFDAAFSLASAQRNTKILGGFARLAKRDGKPGYLPLLPRARAHLQEALRHPVLAPLRLFYERQDLISS